MSNKILFFAICTMVLVACAKQSGSQTDKQNVAQQQNEEQHSFESSCRQTMRQIQQLQQKMNNPQQYTTAEGIRELQRLNSELSFNYDASSLDVEQFTKALQVDSLVRETRSMVEAGINQNIRATRQPLLCKQEELMTEAQTYPFYLERGDKLMLNLSAEKPIDIRLYNADSHQLLKTYAAKKLVNDSLPINYKAVYLVEINPKGRQYVDINITYKPCSVERVLNPKSVKSEEVEGLKGDFRVRTVKGLNMKNIFEEPRKFTLRSQLKATFSNTMNSDRAIVGVQVPAGATDVLYSLRISTSEGNHSSDGEFSNNMLRTYKKVKFLGLPIYEREKEVGSSLIGRLLGDNKPPREEEAYVNMYVFYNAAQAKRFQDGADVGKLQYSIDYSQVGTQSCNGRVPTKGCKTIYFGFRNERVRYSNYLWLEAVSAVPKNEYIKTVYTVK